MMGGGRWGASRGPYSGTDTDTSRNSRRGRDGRLVSNSLSKVQLQLHAGVPAALLCPGGEGQILSTQTEVCINGKNFEVNQ